MSFSSMYWFIYLLDVNNGLASDGIEDAEDGKLDDAIIPYPECEPFDKVKTTMLQRFRNILIVGSFI